MVYLHLTHKGHEDAYERLNALMHGLGAMITLREISLPLLQSTWSAILALPTAHRQVISAIPQGQSGRVGPQSLSGSTLREATPRQAFLWQPPLPPVSAA